MSRVYDAESKQLSLADAGVDIPDFPITRLEHEGCCPACRETSDQLAEVLPTLAAIGAAFQQIASGEGPSIMSMLGFGGKKKAAKLVQEVTGEPVDMPSLR